MRLSFYAGLFAFACTVQAVTLGDNEKDLSQIDAMSENVNKSIDKMMKPSKEEQLPTKLQKSNVKTMG